MLAFGTKMPKITLVFSAHRENGLCNFEELLKILRAIEPEIIFEEIRPSDFDSYCKHGTKSTLETQAIARYLDFKSVRRVPVDRYDIPGNRMVEFKRELDCAFDYVEQTSREYQLLHEENHRNAHQHGFRYLNSAALARAMARVSEIEEKIINETGAQGLMRCLEKWRHMTQCREREMIGNIYDYCRENVFDVGVFLIGAAHQAGIVKEIETFSSTEVDLIDWSFLYDGK